jgi:hypothetical protein
MHHGSLPPLSDIPFRPKAGGIVTNPVECYRQGAGIGGGSGHEFFCRSGNSLGSSRFVTDVEVTSGRRTNIDRKTTGPGRKRFYGLVERYYGYLLPLAHQDGIHLPTYFSRYSPVCASYKHDGRSMN